MITDEQRDELRQSITTAITAGFRERDDIVAGALELFAGEVEAAELEVAVAGIFDEAHAAFLEEQQRWPQTTDCDRLDAAFEALNAAEIAARHDWRCCQTCGHSAMGREHQRLSRERPGSMRGYAFYHNQDTDSAVEGGGLMLAYGAADERATSVEVAKEIVAALERQGLSVEWNGSTDTRIFVRLTWQRRARPPRFCET